MPNLACKILCILKRRKRRAKNIKKNLRYPMDTLKSLSFIIYLYILYYVYQKRVWGKIGFFEFSKRKKGAKRLALFTNICLIQF